MVSIVLNLIGWESGSSLTGPIIGRSEVKPMQPRFTFDNELKIALIRLDNSNHFCCLVWSTAIVSFLFHNYIPTLQNKIERQEARFKGTHLPRVSLVPSARPVHVNPISTGTITNSGISHTITGN